VKQDGKAGAARMALRETAMTVNSKQAEKRPAVDAADSKTEPQADQREAVPKDEAGWHTKTVSALREAEDLLDSLEAQGVTERELVVLSETSFAVRWR
jgi:hypothetical protein